MDGVMDEIDKTFSPWQLVQHTLSHFHHTFTYFHTFIILSHTFIILSHTFTLSHFQPVAAGSNTLSRFHHTLTFTLSPSARGSWINQITITNSIQCILLTAKLVILVILSSSWFTFTFQNRSPLNGEVTYEATNWSKIFSQVTKLQKFSFATVQWRLICCLHIIDKFSGIQCEKLFRRYLSP